MIYVYTVLLFCLMWRFFFFFFFFCSGARVFYDAGRRAKQGEPILPETREWVSWERRNPEQAAWDFAWPQANYQWPSPEKFSVEAV